MQTVDTSKGAWVFVPLPVDQADELLAMETRRSGFGSVRVSVRIGSSAWKTSVFPSNEQATYLLPVKRQVRERENIDVGDRVEVVLTVEI